MPEESKQSPIKSFLKSQSLPVFGVALALFLFGGIAAALFIDSTPLRAGQTGESYSYLGHRAYLTLLDEVGIKVHLNHRSLAGSKKLPPILYLAPDPELSSDFLNRKLASELGDILPYSPAVLMAMKKWSIAVDHDKPTWSKRRYLRPPDEALSFARQVLKEIPPEKKINFYGEVLQSTPHPTKLEIRRQSDKIMLAQSELSGEEYKIKADNLQFFSAVPSDSLVLVKTQKGPLVIEVERKTKHGRGRGKAKLILVSDPDIFTNGHLAREDNAGLALELGEYLAGEEKRIIYDEVSHGLGKDPTMLELLLTPPGLFITIHLLLLTLLWAFWKSRPFISQEEEPRRERSRAEQVKSLANLTHAGGDHKFFLRRYFFSTLYYLKELFPSLESMSLEEKLSYLEKIEKEKKMSLSIRQIYQRARRAKTPSEIESIVQQIHHWKESLSHGKYSRT